ncbi:hypothetical protein ACEPAH_9315 [Sanghuangporus vaninii]
MNKRRISSYLVSVKLSGDALLKRGTKDCKISWIRLVKKKLHDLRSSAEKTEERREKKVKKSDAKERLKNAMTDIQRLRHPSQKG